MPEKKELCRSGCWLLAAIVLAGCGHEKASVSAADTGPVEFRIPSVPTRAPIDTARLGGNVFDSICQIGNPFAVVGWDADAQTRFLYFVGPFSGSGDGANHPYMYMAIPGPDRERMNTTLYLDRLDEAELRKHFKASETRQFLLPHIVGLPADEEETRRQLGEPALTRKLESGHTRSIFDRQLCLNNKRLVGLYIDADDGRRVAAKGIDHPDRLKRLLSSGRPPQPDPRPTYYQDWEPRKDSAQEAALKFLFLFESRNAAGAGANLWQPDSPPHPLAELEQVFADGSTIDMSTLTYQTTRYELDRAEVAIAFALANGRGVRITIEMRDAEDKRWLVSDWRHDSGS